MKTGIIELRKGGFINKGAELMLLAALEQLKAEFPDSRFAMAPTVSAGSAPYSKRAKLQFFQKAHFWRFGIQWGPLAALIPKKVRDMLGIVLNSEIDVVIDLAGFAYSDQWGYESCVELANSCNRWKRVGTKVILLPQALGPYDSSANKRAMQKAVDNIDLIFARDRESYSHLVNVVGERSNIKIAPDFTNLIQGVVPDYFDREAQKFCIIPNQRMVDKTDDAFANAYLRFMVNIVNCAADKDLKPFILLHEGYSDLDLADKIQKAANQDITIIQEEDPLYIKGIVGASESVVGSRFHGLVSALSQGKPALATGWSHKYKMLFEDYGFPEGLLDVHASLQEINEVIDKISNGDAREEVVQTIEKNGRRLRCESEAMWKDVNNILRS